MKPMPELGAKCVKEFNKTLAIASATETLWLTARPTSSVRQQLKVGQLEALYEATFLRVFSAYEAFLEGALSHYMAKYETPTHTPTPAVGRSLYPRLSDALSALYNGKDYLLWHGVAASTNRSKRFLDACPVETVLLTNQNNLEDYANIRHHIAHNSRDSKKKFEAAALRLTGSSYSRGSGQLLRSANIADPLNQPKWIRTIVDDMAATVLLVCP